MKNHTWQRRTATTVAAALGLAALAAAQGETGAPATGAPGTKEAAAPKSTVKFSGPVRMKAAGAYVRTEAPGYAAPCWHDVDGDGHRDLVVGQFNDGKMKVYKNDGQGNLAAGEWLMAGGDVAEVPGVW